MMRSPIDPCARSTGPTVTAPPYAITWSPSRNCAYLLYAEVIDNLCAYAYATAVRVQVGSLRRPPAPSGADVSAYYDVDAVGSVRAITNDAGVTTARYDYLPFGERFNAPAPSARSSAIQPRQYTGKEYDLETEFDYFGGRFYRPVWGRFTTVDPTTNVDASLFEPQRWNRYIYATNRPLVMADPDGREAGYVYLPNGRMLSPYDEGFPRSQHPIRDTVVLAGVFSAALFGPVVVQGAIEAGPAIALWLTRLFTPHTLRFDASSILDDINKVSHMFQEAHQLDVLGARPEALSKIAGAIQKAYMAGELSLREHGVFEQPVIIDGRRVFVQGRIVGDVLRIGDAWIRNQ